MKPLTERKRVKNVTELAAALGVSRQAIYDWLKLSGHPVRTANGSYMVADWREWVAANGRDAQKSDSPDMSRERARKEAALAWRAEFRNREMQGEYWPREMVKRVCAQAIHGMKQRLFSGIPRLLALVKLAKDDETALTAVRGEMIQALRCMENCDWFKDDPNLPKSVRRIRRTD